MKNLKEKVGIKATKKEAEIRKFMDNLYKKHGKVLSKLAHE